MRKFFSLHFAAVLFLALGIFFLFDQEGASALLMLVVLSCAAAFGLHKFGVRQREVYLLLFFIIVVHGAFALFVHYTDFQPFSSGGGDFVRYDSTAGQIAERVRQGNLSLEGLVIVHYFPLLMGYVYALVASAMVVGQLFVVWIAALATLALYFITREIGANRLWSFLVALFASFYPSFFFFTSYVLKDALIILLVLLSLLFLLKLLQRFSWKNYAVLFLLAFPLANLRSEMYDAVAITFFVSWFTLAKTSMKRRFVLGIVLFALFGLPPLATTTTGYYDIMTYRSDLNLEKAKSLKEDVYLVVSPQELPSEKPEQPRQERAVAPSTLHNGSVAPSARNNDIVLPSSPESKRSAVSVSGQEKSPQGVQTRRGRDSTVKSLKVGEGSPAFFVWQQAKGFAFAVLGPFPWQFSKPRHAVALAETLPWMLLLPFVLRGIVGKFREDRRARALALALFAFLVLGLVGLFINNFGVSMRIRMPGILVLLPFLAFAFHSPYPPFFGAILPRLPLWFKSIFGLADFGGQAIQKVIFQLEQRGVNVRSLCALDMFAGEGTVQTRGYANRVGTLDAWEIDPALVSRLKRNIPKAAVRVVNSVEEMQKQEHQGKYDLLVIDNHTACYGPKEQYCEHFEVLPQALSLLKPQGGIVVFNVNREAPGAVATESHRQRKAAFFGIGEEEWRPLDLSFLEDFYTRLFERYGYEKRFFFSVSRGGTHRNDYLHSFVYKLEKASWNS